MSITPGAWGRIPLQAVVAAYEARQGELQKENKDLKASLASLQASRASLWQSCGEGLGGACRAGMQGLLWEPLERARLVPAWAGTDAPALMAVGEH